MRRLGLVSMAMAMAMALNFMSTSSSDARVSRNTFSVGDCKSPQYLGQKCFYPVSENIINLESTPDNWKDVDFERLARHVSGRPEEAELYLSMIDSKNTNSKALLKLAHVHKISVDDDQRKILYKNDSTRPMELLMTQLDLLKKIARNDRLKIILNFENFDSPKVQVDLAAFRGLSGPLRLGDYCVWKKVEIEKARQPGGRVQCVGDAFCRKQGSAETERYYTESDLVCVLEKNDECKSIDVGMCQRSVSNARSNPGGSRSRSNSGATQ